MTNAASKITVFGLLADTQACGKYRIAIPLNALPSDEFNSLGDTTITDWWSKGYDIVVGQRISSDEQLKRWEQIALHPRIKTVIDIDDDLWHLEPNNPAYPYFSRKEVQANLHKALGMADLVTVSTSELQQRAWPSNPNVKVMPNCVEDTIMTLPYIQSGKGVVRVGWSGSPTHKGDWEECRVPVSRVVAEKKAELVMVGAMYEADLDRSKIRHIPWAKEINDYYNNLRVNIDIGLAPLAKNYFNASKSAIRAIEYAALGIPLVASNFGPYKDYVVHGKTGYLCDDEDDWYRYLKLLIGNRELRDEIGQNAREYAKNRLISNNVNLWATAYKELVGR